MKKYKWWIVTFIVSVITINSFEDYINISFLLGNEFNLITINTVLVGFLFTIYTILIPLLDEDALKAYTITGEINSIFKNISVGIITGILSVIFTIIGLALFKSEAGSQISRIHEIWLTIEITLFILTMISTLFSIININSVVESVRNNKLNKSNHKETNKKMENRFRR